MIFDLSMEEIDLFDASSDGGLSSGEESALEAELCGNEDSNNSQTVFHPRSSKNDDEEQDRELILSDDQLIAPAAGGDDAEV